MTWQEKVKALMKEQGLNQKQLSKMSGITEVTISRYLKGRRRPMLDTVSRFAKALGVTVEYILDDETVTEPYAGIAAAIAKNVSSLTAEEKNRLIALIVGFPT